MKYFTTLQFIIFAFNLTIAFAVVMANGASFCDGDPKCVSTCTKCPTSQAITAPCCFGVYEGQNCVVWSPSARANLCTIGSSSASNPPVSCQTCLGCQDANTCSSVKCSNKDTGTCCYKRSNENGPPDLFQWYCKGCANCSSGYVQTAYQMKKANCRACKPDESRGIDCI